MDSPPGERKTKKLRPDDAWESDVFHKFDELMEKYDYFETNATVRLDEEVVKLLDNPFYEKGYVKEIFRKPEKEGAFLMPNLLGSETYITGFADMAIAFYNEKMKKILTLDRVYKANFVTAEFCWIYLLTIDTIDPSSAKQSFYSILLLPGKKKAFEELKPFEDLVWLFKPKPSNSFYYQKDEDDEDGWESDSFQTWPAFSWDFFDYRRIVYKHAEEKKEEIMDQVKRHCSEVRNSKGFDVPTMPPCPYKWLGPLPERGKPSKNDAEAAARYAVQTYNGKKGKQMEFVTVSRSYYCHEKYTIASDKLYFITLGAVDSCTLEQKTFLTNVSHHKDGTMHVRFFRRKRHHHDDL